MRWYRQYNVGDLSHEQLHNNQIESSTTTLRGFGALVHVGSRSDVPDVAIPARFCE